MLGFHLDKIKKTQWEKWGVPKQEIKNTPKLFYGKYPYKVDLKVDNAWLYRKIRFYSNRNDFIYEATNRHSWHKPDTRLLLRIYDACQILAKDVRIRVGHCSINICTKTEEQLIDIIKSAKLRNYIIKVHRPISDESKEKIKNGIVFIKNPKHKFRVMIRGNVYDATVRIQILDYFNTHKDIMFISPGVMYRLELDFDTWIQGYFHVDNTDILFFLRIIAPKFIGKIFQLEVLQDK